MFGRAGRWDGSLTRRPARRPSGVAVWGFCKSLSVNYKNLFIMPIALLELGNNVPLERCVSEIGKAQDGSLRETLLTYLAQKLHGKTFMNEVRARAATQEGKEKWGRLLNQMLKAQESAPQQR
jgi:hypothetical protein